MNRPIFVFVLLTVAVIFGFSNTSANNKLKDEITKAEKAYKSGDKMEATELYTKLIGSGKLSSDDLVTCYMGRAFSNSNNTDHAIMDLRRVLQIAPNKKEICPVIIQFIDRGYTLNMFSFSGGKSKTLAALKVEMAENGANWLRSEGLMGWLILYYTELMELIDTTKYNQSLDKSKMGNNELENIRVAVENFSEIISQDSTPLLKRVVNLYDRSIAYEKLQEYEKAISDLEQIVLLAPKEPSSKRRLSALLEKQGLNKNDIQKKLTALEREPADGYLYLGEKKPIILSELKQLPVCGLFIGQDFNHAKQIASGLLTKYDIKIDDDMLSEQLSKIGDIYVCWGPLTIRATKKRIVYQIYISNRKKLVDNIFNTGTVSGEAFSKAVFSQLNLPKVTQRKGSYKAVFKSDDGIVIIVNEKIKTIYVKIEK